MPSGVIKRPGRQPTRSEQLLLVPIIQNTFNFSGESIVIHHITEDDTYRLQLEIERRIPMCGGTVCTFHRIHL